MARADDSRVVLTNALASGLDRCGSEAKERSAIRALRVRCEDTELAQTAAGFVGKSQHVAVIFDLG